MRIGTKLLLTYLILIGVVGGAAGLLLPRLVESIVARSEHERLVRQADWAAEALARRLRTPQGDGTPSVRQLLTTVENLLPNDTLAIVDPEGSIVWASRQEYSGHRVVQAETQPGQLSWVRRSEVVGVGKVLMASTPFRNPSGPLRGFSVAILQDPGYITEMARPIAYRALVIVGIGLIIALVASALVSRDLVRRLQSTGRAAQAVAEGDLSQRAVVNGKDEIADLARHFNYMTERIEGLVEGMRRSEVARKDLLVMVSHELRTPMTSIAGFAEALRDGVIQGDDRKHRYYEIIAGEAARLNRLVNDVFDVAKLEAGQLELRMQDMAVTAWLLDFVERNGPRVQTAGIQLALEMTEQAEMARVHGDRDRLDQVMNNFLDNAMRYNPDGGVIRVGALIDADDVVISVVDQGPGIAPEEQATVFDRFYQGINNGRGQKGAGLGLFIVRSIVEAHGGSVGVKEGPGGGAAFWFRLGLLRD